ncbi:MAG TPA: hypothetical protein VKB00_02870 [Candidatus Limnocylindrales bacterium]|nr:hypothetical protein [Candidatus Limnocylindrales bacterium]
MTEEQRGKDTQVDRPEDDSSWDEGRWSETDAPHEEQDAGTLHVPHEGEEGQTGDAA